MTLAQDILAFLQQNADDPARKAQANTAYTGSTRIHYGLTNPQMREFLKAALSEWSPDYETWCAALDDLYHGHSMEERVFAGMLLARFRTFRARLSLDALDAWLGQLEGWAEIDNTCQSSFGAAEILARWEAWQSFLRRLAAESSIHKRRAALVLLTLPIRESTDPRILALGLELASSLMHEKDKLISKAVSWLLRNGIKHHRGAVAAFLEQNQQAMPAFVVREVRTKLTTGKKQVP
jgi:3-methyladenine DNA glycosylase AlkD